MKQSIPRIIIATVGTSLMGNIRNSERGELKSLLESGNTVGLAAAMRGLPSGEHLLGAEIQSITGILAQKLASADALILLVSDTEDGRLIGNLLKRYFDARPEGAAFASVAVKVLEGLSDQDPERFRKEGLRNLVREISQAVRKYGAQNVLINATGGYKAQISFAGMIGQALGISTCYQFERFDKVIELPPQPVAFDLSLWLNQSGLFFELDEGLEVDDEQVLPDPAMESLVETVDLDGRAFLKLSPTGQLFHESFRSRFERLKETMLPPASTLDPPAKKILTEHGTGDRPPGLRRYLENILRVPYVQRIRTWYYNPDLDRPKVFKRTAGTRIGEVEGWYTEKGALAKFVVHTSASTDDQTLACMADLNQRSSLGLF